MKKIISKNGFRTTTLRSSIMTKIKSRNTIAEVILRKALRESGLRYKINNNKILWKPDIVFLEHKLAIFVDGDFWHGYKWKRRKPRLISNRKYWINKIESNIERDKKINKQLRKAGWHIARFWEHEIKTDVEKCTSKIFHLLQGVTNLIVIFFLLYEVY